MTKYIVWCMCLMLTWFIWLKEPVRHAGLANGKWLIILHHDKKDWGTSVVGYDKDGVYWDIPVGNIAAINKTEKNRILTQGR